MNAQQHPLRCQQATYVARVRKILNGFKEHKRHFAAKLVLFRFFVHIHFRSA
jgi:hypothetical protein